MLTDPDPSVCYPKHIILLRLGFIFGSPGIISNYIFPANVMTDVGAV